MRRNRRRGASALTAVRRGPALRARAGRATPVIVIDFDDTLVDDVPAARLAVRLTLAGLGLPSDAVAAGIVLAHAQRLWSAHPHRRTGPLTYVSSWEVLWLPAEAGLPAPVAASLAGHDERVWAAALTALHADARLAPDAAAAFRHARVGLLRPLPGARETLAALREAGHLLWLATNGLAAHQNAKINAAGLRDCFDQIFISETVGAPKSAPGFATVLATALAATRRRVCMVIGDSRLHDLGLAAHGGWPGVHLCRITPCPDRIATADAVHTSQLDLALHYCRCHPTHDVAPDAAGDGHTTR